MEASRKRRVEEGKGGEPKSGGVWTLGTRTTLGTDTSRSRAGPGPRVRDLEIEKQSNHDGSGGARGGQQLNCLIGSAARTSVDGTLLGFRGTIRSVV